MGDSGKGEESYGWRSWAPLDKLRKGSRWASEVVEVTHERDAGCWEGLFKCCYQDEDSVTGRWRYCLEQLFIQVMYLADMCEVMIMYPLIGNIRPKTKVSWPWFWMMSVLTSPSASSVRVLISSVTDEIVTWIPPQWPMWYSDAVPVDGSTLNRWYHILGENRPTSPGGQALEVQGLETSITFFAAEIELWNHDAYAIMWWLRSFCTPYEAL